MNPSDAPKTPSAGRSSSAFFLGELPYHELLRKRDPQKARKLEACMQQILGEAVYFFDGRVIDSIGPRMIAVMPDATRALEAARKSQLDLLDHNRRQPPNGDIVEAALVVHSGAAVSDGSALTSPIVTAGLQLLRSIQPLQLVVSEPALREAGEKVRGRPIGEFSGIRFYEPPPVEPPPPPPEVTEKPIPVAPKPVKKAVPVLLFAAIGAGLLVAGLVGFVLLRPKQEKAASVPAALVDTQAPAPTPVVQRRKQVAVTGFAAISTNRSVSSKAARTEQLVTTVLRRHPDIELSTSGTVLELTPGRKAPAVVPAFGGTPGTEMRLDKPGVAAGQILGLVADSLAIPRNELTTTRPEAIEKFEEAVRTKSVSSAQKAIDLDTSFVPALRFGVELFDEQRDYARAVAAADKLLSLYPDDVELRRKRVRWLMGSGRSSDAVPSLATLLHASPSDPDTLAMAARLSLSVLDEPRYRDFARRHGAATRKRIFHDPDIQLTQGQIDAAVREYYELERQDPENAALALKIGRIAVLRHSLSMAQLEVEKLSRLDPDYGYPLLSAYVAAEKRRPDEAVSFLKTAEAGARWTDDFYTASAEVYAILSQQQNVVDSLRKAVANGESLTYILTNPLLRYLHSESPDFQLMRPQIEQQRSALRELMSQLSR